MPFDPKQLADYERLETEIGPSNTELEKGKYLFRVSAEHSDLAKDNNGIDVLRLAMVVAAGESINRQHSVFLRYFVPEVSPNNDRPYEDRLSQTRAMFKQFIRDLRDALAESPTSNQEVGEALQEVLGNINEENAEEMLSFIPSVLDGQEFWGEITKPNKKGFRNLRPIKYQHNLASSMAV